jgi:HEAT repeat protein
MPRLFVIGFALLLAGCGPRSTAYWVGQLKDPDVVKRRQAIRELGAKNGDAQVVVPALTEALQDESSYVRHDAATALGKFGPESKPAIPKLAQLLKDKELSVRKAAEAALSKIDPDALIKTEPAAKSPRRR